MLRSLLYSRHVASGITYNFNRQREPAFRQARVMLAVHGGSVDDRIGGLVISKTSSSVCSVGSIYCLSWPSCVADADIIFRPVVSSSSFFLSSFFIA